MPNPGAPPTNYQPDENLKKMRTQFFDARRGEAVQGANAQTQQGDDAIQRRFASMGAQGSGAQIAAMQKNRDGGMEAQRKAQADVGALELQAGEADHGRDFQLGMAREMSDKDLAFKQRLSDTEQGNKLQEMDLAKQQFELDKETTAFNKQMAIGEMDAAKRSKMGKFEQQFGTNGWTTGADSVLDPLGFGRGGGK